MALASTFVGLGFWQLDRAREFKELQKPYVEKPEVALSEVATAGTNLSDAAINRRVIFTGRYVMQFDAPNQADSQGQISRWRVALMEVDGGGAILVGRTNIESELPRGEVDVRGRLLPRQFEDRVAKVEGELSRIDPSLISALYPDPLYDGFVIATSESVAGSSIELPRISIQPAKPTVPGYYWQHISYVVIWWLMALVVLFMPFYSRWRRGSGSTARTPHEGGRL